MEKKKKMELIKRAKGLLALVLCFGMMFGNSLVVFAANNYVINSSTLPSGLGEGTILTTGDTIKDGRYGDALDSGGVILIYQDADGDDKGRLEKTGADKKATVGEVDEGTTITPIPSRWEITEKKRLMGEEGRDVFRFTLKALPEDQNSSTTPDPASSPSTGGQNNSIASQKDAQKQPATPHTHSFEWTVTKEPTKTQDGLEEYRCRGCGAVEASQPISANMFKVKELYGLVKDAPKGGAVAYDFGDLATISDYVLGKMAERNDVAVTVSFTYGGEAHSITFPAGTDYAAVLEDADTMYGFYGVAAKLGLTVE